MNILWITNSLFPEAISKICDQSILKGSGGWMLGLSEALMKTGEVQLTVAGVTPLVKKTTRIEGEHISYYAIPLFSKDRRYDNSFESVYRDVYTQVRPDVVHIHGTEFPHSLAALRACGTIRTVVSLQGLASAISRYYLAGITKSEIIKSPTVHDLLRPSIFQQQREMEQRGRCEVQLIKEANYVIGRTDWDYAHIWSINPNIRYFHCNEILRKEFYDGDRWSYKNCVPNSIFLSQGSYPLKGLHKVLEAIPLVKRFFPDVSLRIAGHDIIHNGEGFRGLLKLSTYGRIVKRSIHDHGLETSVSFLGPLNAEKMKQEYLKANVFICPSSIENSPNSLGEAQMMGTPCLASYAGGIPSFMNGNEAGLFRFEEVEMLAKMICEIFEKKGQLDTSSLRAIAKSRHDVDTIVNKVIEIYREIAHR